MKIKTLERQEIPTSIDVEFPIYRAHNLMFDEYDDVIYTRLDANGTEWNIHRIQCYRDDSVEFQVSKSLRNLSRPIDEPDYVLGRGRYECTPEKFYEVLKEAVDFINSYHL
jgi:hypothetical protein